MQQVSRDETTIRVKRTNKERMANIGKKDDSYDDILQNLLDYYESNPRKFKKRLKNDTS
jgi:hypothetical protein